MTVLLAEMFAIGLLSVFYFVIWISPWRSVLLHKPLVGAVIVLALVLPPLLMNRFFTKKMWLPIILSLPAALFSLNLVWSGFLTGYDPIAFWGPKAKSLYSAEFQLLGQPDYPLFHPILMALGSSFAGSWNDVIGRTSHVLLFLVGSSYILYCLSTGAVLWDALIALFLFALVKATSFFTFFTNGYADGLVAFLMTMNVVSLGLLWERDSRCKKVVCLLMGLCFFLPGWTKNEGLFFALIVLGVFFLSVQLRERVWSRLSFFKTFGIGLLGSLLLFALPMILLRHKLGISGLSGGTFSQAGLIENLQWDPLVQRFGVIMPYLRTESWFVALGICVLIAMPAARSKLSWLFAAWLCCLGFIGFTYVVTTAPLQWHLDTSFQRLTLQIAGLKLVFLCVALKELVAVASGWQVRKV